MSEITRTIIFDTIVNGSGGSGGTRCNIVNFDIASIASGSTIDNITYIGYGTETACKILRVQTISGTSYSSLWSNGEETLDKIWVDRETLAYF
jgi:hypothetical protein